MLVGLIQVQLEEVRRESEPLGGRVEIGVCEVRGVETARRLAESTLERHGRIDVLVNNYNMHYGSGRTVHVEIDLPGKDYPVLHGVQNFKFDDSLYRNTPSALDTTLLLPGRTEEQSEWELWNRLHRGGRGFYTSLGQQKDFAGVKTTLFRVRW